MKTRPKLTYNTALEQSVWSECFQHKDFRHTIYFTRSQFAAKADEYRMNLSTFRGPWDEEVVYEIDVYFNPTTMTATRTESKYGGKPQWGMSVFNAFAAEATKLIEVQPSNPLTNNAATFIRAVEKTIAKLDGEELYEAFHDELKSQVEPTAVQSTPGVLSAFMQMADNLRSNWPWGENSQSAPSAAPKPE